jgi:hypothetical protein
MYQKRKALSANYGILAKTYIVETKVVNLTSVARVVEKTGGGNMKVSLAMLLKTNVEKMSENRSLAMLMKAKEKVGWRIL